ncbi:MAG: hypothetical protein JWR19_498 [Pedosphaera sp.]|nr:hypothetical protein [Pedosphaera sp.]
MLLISSVSKVKTSATRAESFVPARHRHQKLAGLFLICFWFAGLAATSFAGESAGATAAATTAPTTNAAAGGSPNQPLYSPCAVMRSRATH